MKNLVGIINRFHMWRHIQNFSLWYTSNAKIHHLQSIIFKIREIEKKTLLLRWKNAACMARWKSIFIIVASKVTRVKSLKD